MKASRWHTKIAKTVFLLFAVTGFAAPQSPNSNGNSNPLLIEVADQNFSNNPALLERITASPHGYFRFINILFSSEVCNRFRDMLVGTPTFNLHGDAHIEQYAITDLGRGLTDFDDSSTGPAVLDLMRFGVSLHLACRQLGWEDESDSIYAGFLDGYRNALSNTESEPPIPSVIKNIKQNFRFDREKYFGWIDSIMQPMPEAQQEKLLHAMKSYVENMYFEKPDLQKHFLDIKATGALKLGIGSAQDIKYLVRAEGETADPLDDLVLEIKQVRDLSGIDCITITQQNDPFRVLVGQARIAYEPYRFLGYIRLDGMSFWVHSWVDNYKEIEIGESFKTMDEMAEIAFDVGVQLGRGHTNQIAAPLDVQLRREQLRLLEKHEHTIRQACFELTDLTVAAWREFRSNIHYKKE